MCFSVHTLLCTEICHLLLWYMHSLFQIFFLHNVDLGIFNKKHNVLPRISDFDQNSLKNMITMATDIGKGPTSYVKCMVNIAAQMTT